MKGECERGDMRGIGVGAEPLEQALMAAVHGVEIAHGDVGAASGWRKITHILDRDHGRDSPRPMGANQPGGMVIR